MTPIEDLTFDAIEKEFYATWNQMRDDDPEIGLGYLASPENEDTRIVALWRVIRDRALMRSQLTTALLTGRLFGGK